MRQQPVVSVCMITYNHEAYIAQAIEGVMRQKTDFPIELVIGEDCSTDRTREICKEFQNKYPAMVRLLPRTKNVGMIPNFVDALKNCGGKYTALCEGDDYWTDPYKLSRQVDYLQKNESYIAVCSDAKVWSEVEQREIEGVPRDTDEADITFEDVLRSTGMLTPTVLFRNIELPLHLMKPKYAFGDICLWLMLLDHGPARFFNRKEVVYRKHPGGATSTVPSDKFDATLKEFLIEFNELTQGRRAGPIEIALKILELKKPLQDHKLSALAKCWRILGFMLRHRSTSATDLRVILGLAFGRRIDSLRSWRRRIFR